MTSKNLPNPLFSAYAEVFLALFKAVKAAFSFLCLRRGVSVLNAAWKQSKYFSLPTQRCFFFDLIPFGNELLFSAYAEVFPRYGGQDC